MSTHSELQLTLIWGNDGWCYIPQLKVREKFQEKNYIQEDWEGVIAIPEYVEKMSISDWISSSDSLPLKTSIRDIRMKLIDQLGLHQQSQ